jgi:hypothetical protein
MSVLPTISDDIYPGLFEQVIFIRLTSMENDFYFLQWRFPSLNKQKKHLQVYVLDFSPQSRIVLTRTRFVEHVIC